MTLNKGDRVTCISNDTCGGLLLIGYDYCIEDINIQGDVKLFGISGFWLPRRFRKSLAVVGDRYWLVESRIPGPADFPWQKRGLDSYKSFSSAESAMRYYARLDDSQAWRVVEASRRVVASTEQFEAQS